MNHIDAKGKACPMPVMMAKKEMDTGCESLSITVDNAIAVQNLSRLAAQFAEEAACRGWTIGPAEKSTRSLFTTWLERRVSKQKSNNFNPQQYATNNTWYRPQGLAARMPHTPRHGLIE